MIQDLNNPDERLPVEDDPLTAKMIAAAIEVHRFVGPGALESTYETLLAHELTLRGLEVQRQVELPVVYKGVRVDCGDRVDLIVEGKVIIELKAVEKLAPIHEAQLITYLKLSGIRRGLLLNFNVRLLKDGIIRRVV
jgi:GxxExxY protein